MVDSPSGAEEDSHVFFEGVMAETKERLGSIDECMEDVPLLQGVEDAASEDVKTVDPSALGADAKIKVTEEEARKALSVLVEFFEDQPRGSLDVAEGMLLGRLKEKLLR
jgi:hypothetical protein